MERVGLVEQVEAELERVIVLGMLPDCGSFGSEEKLARSHGVSRTTVREALRRLAARGLVVQRPGRNTRARALDESLTLENLGLALHDERSLVSRRLLEGYFSLKRQVTVELLADCAKHASKEALQRLGDACFGLWDVACLRLGERCVQMEFELLKLAAWALDRPGHLLLLQSLQRAFQGIATRVLPLVECEALGQWASWAMNALHERDAEALQRKLPALLKACDARVLSQLAPVLQEKGPPHLQRSKERGLGSTAPAAQEDAAFQAPPAMETRGLEEDALGARPTPEACGLGCLTPVSERGLPGAACANPSDCRTASCASPPEVGPHPEPPSASSRGPTRVATRSEDGPFHGTWGPHRPPLPTPQDNLPPEHQQPFAASTRTKASRPSPEG
jgi:DNA-binding FadR family transcriptional regulator